jgi:hypothetical protein
MYCVRGATPADKLRRADILANFRYAMTPDIHVSALRASNAPSTDRVIRLS